MALTLLLLGALMTSRAMAACSDRAALASLDEDRLLGEWHHIKQTTFNWPGGAALKCQHSVFSRASDGDFASELFFYNTSSSDYVSIKNHMHKLTEGSTDGKYEFHREGQHASRSSKWYIVGTDYDNYAVVWICSKRPNSDDTFEVNFVFTRNKNPSASVLESANALLPEGEYTTNDQDDCPAHEHN